MSGHKGAGRWQAEEIEWGLELARALNVGIEDYDYWSDEDGADEDGADEDGAGEVGARKVGADEEKGTSEQDRLREETERANLLRSELTTALRKLVPENATPGQVIPGATPEDIAGVITKATELAQRIVTADLSSLQAMDKGFDGLADEIAEARGAVQRRAAEKQRIEGEASKITADGADGDESDRLSSSVAEVSKVMAGAPLTNAMLEDGRRALTVATNEAAQIGNAVQARLDENNRLGNETGKVVDPECLPDQEKRLGTARTAVADLLKPPVSTKGNQDAAAALEDLRKAVVTVQDELKPLGNLEGIKSLCGLAGIKTEDYAAFETQLGGRVAVGELLKVLPAARLGGLTKALGTAGPEALAALVKSFGSPAALDTAIKNLGKNGDAKLAGLVTAGKLDGAGVKKLCDGIGTSFVGALMEGSNDPKDALAIQAKLGGNTKSLQDLNKQAGFEQKPAALVALFRKGCAGNIDTFAALCTDFDDEADRKNLGGLIDDAGLGDAPDAFGALFATGCGGNVVSLKALGESFSGDANKGSRDGLKLMLTTGGLAAGKGVLPHGDVQPECLAELLKLGSGPGLAGTSKAGEDKRKGDGLAKLCAGLDATACGNLAKAMKSGGLGTEPEVFGHLVGVGCVGDPAKLAGLSAELGKNAKNLTGLNTLLKQGGFGSTTAVGGATGIDKTCLGKLFETGCEGRPDELVKLVTQLGATDLLALEGVMTGGGLGQHPNVLGNLYKHGCLDLPNGATDGAKDPKVLKDLVGEFKPPGGPAQFRDLLVNGGFTANDDRLGSVVRYGLAGKGPNDKPDGKKLKQLHTAFDTHMGDLVTVMDAFDGAPDTILETSKPGEPNQPGKAFRNVVQAPGHAGKLDQLHAKFFTKLKTRSAGPHNSPVTRLTMDELIQNAASFEHEPCAAAPINMDMPPPIDVHYEHIVQRHTRQQCAFLLANSSKSTLYPRTIAGAEIQTQVKAVFAAIPKAGPARGNRPDGTPMKDPPGDTDDLNGNYASYEDLPYDGGAYKIGFNPAPGVTIPPGGAVYVAQFFPKDTNPGMLTIHKTDMQAMKDALL